MGTYKPNYPQTTLPYYIDSTIVYHITAYPHPWLCSISDDHALGMVRSGVHLDLVTPLRSDSPQLQMAALSLLRNLCLPSANKAALLEAGTLDHLLALSVTEQPALFKVSWSTREAEPICPGRENLMGRAAGG